MPFTKAFSISIKCSRGKYFVVGENRYSGRQRKHLGTTFCYYRREKLMSQKVIKIVGSGTNNVVSGDLDRLIFVNTSFSRAPDLKSIVNLVLAEGYCDLSQVFKSTNTNSELRKIRLKKVLLLENKHVENLIIITRLKRSEIELGLKELKLSYEKLTLVSNRSFYLYLLKFLLLNKKITKNLFFQYLLSVITNRKPPVMFRPSNGVAAGILAMHNEPIASIVYDGFLSRESYYGKDLNQHFLRNEHEKIDRYLIDAMGASLC